MAIERALLYDVCAAVEDPTERAGCELDKALVSPNVNLFAIAPTEDHANAQHIFGCHKADVLNGRLCS